MIRLNLKPSIIENLSFNKDNKTLEIEFKRHIKITQCINISMSILQDYVKTFSPDNLTEKPFQSNLKIVHSNFKTS